MANPGNPNCIKCNGRGGFRGPRGWRKCSCMKPTKEQGAAQDRLNSIGASRDYRIPLFDKDDGA